jgi:SAM-dependent methyltransferase
MVICRQGLFFKKRCLLMKTTKDKSVTRHLDLGCGAAPRNPFSAKELHGIDIGHRLSDEAGKVFFTKANLVLDPIPYPDGYFDSVSAYDFLEHIPRLICRDGNTEFPFVRLMNEIYRVLNHNGIFYAVTPLYPKESAFVDPTHVNYIARDTYKYFVQPHLWASMYGFTGAFHCERVAVVNFACETEKSTGLRWYRRKILFSLFPKLSQHIVWRFAAIKA